MILIAKQHNVHNPFTAPLTFSEILSLTSQAYQNMTAYWKVCSIKTPFTIESVTSVIKQTIAIKEGKEKTLRITIHSGSNLAAADPNGKSDPYVKFGLCNRGHDTKFVRMHKTKAISANLNPIYQTKHRNEVEWTISRESAPSFDFVAEVWDKDMFGGDDFLGVAKFSLVFGQDLVQTPLSLKQDPKRKGKVSGHVVVSLRWK
jgi:Ca2+-dependent lipid-binding protein